MDSGERDTRRDDGHGGADPRPEGLGARREPSEGHGESSVERGFRRKVFLAFLAALFAYLFRWLPDAANGADGVEPDVAATRSGDEGSDRTTILDEPKVRDDEREPAAEDADERRENLKALRWIVEREKKIRPENGPAAERILDVATKEFVEGLGIGASLSPTEREQLDADMNQFLSLPRIIAAGEDELDVLEFLINEIGSPRQRAALMERIQGAEDPVGGMSGVGPSGPGGVAPGGDPGGTDQAPALESTWTTASGLSILVSVPLSNGEEGLARYETWARDALGDAVGEL